MKIILNGIPKEFKESLNLKNLVGQFCTDTSHVITEVNGEIVKKDRWAATKVTEGDKVELVNFVGGG